MIVWDQLWISGTSWWTWSVSAICITSLRHSRHSSHCSDNSCNGFPCPDWFTFLTWCCRSLHQCKRPGRMPAKPCGVVIISGMYKRVLSPRGGQESGLATSSRRTTTFTMLEWHGMVTPSCSFLIPVWWSFVTLVISGSRPPMLPISNISRWDSQKAWQFFLLCGQGSQYQAVLIAQDSALGKARKSEHGLWRRAAPITTEFAWLPPDVAWGDDRALFWRCYGEW